MTDEEIKKRKQNLALQAFYLEVKALLENLEKKLNSEPEKSRK